MFLRENMLNLIKAWL